MNAPLKPDAFRAAAEIAPVAEPVIRFERVGKVFTGRRGQKSVTALKSFQRRYEDEPKRLRNRLMHGTDVPIDPQNAKRCMMDARLIEGVSRPFGQNFLGVPEVSYLLSGLDEADLTAAVNGHLKAILDRVRYQWATCLILALDRPLTPYYWLSIGDDLPFVACIEHTNFLPKERYGGNHIVYLSNYTAPGHPVLEMNADEVFQSYLEGIKALNPKFDPSWVKDKWFFKDPGGQPVITTYYSRSIPEMRTGIDGLYLSNTTQVYPEDRGQNYSLILGEKVAALMDEDGKKLAGARGAGI